MFLWGQILAECRRLKVISAAAEGAAGKCFPLDIQDYSASTWHKGELAAFCKLSVRTVQHVATLEASDPRYFPRVYVCIGETLTNNSEFSAFFGGGGH